MASAPMYNTKCAGVKRLMKEAAELAEPTELFAAHPSEDNLFEWHFTIRGPSDSDFEGGIYHGKIFFPIEYPMKPPNLMILTPNGRFELNKKICLSISGYHPETWLPSWSIRTALLALIGFMPSNPNGALGSLNYPPKSRKQLAEKSLEWKCKECGECMKDALKPLTESSSESMKEANELAAQLVVKEESQLKKSLAELEPNNQGEGNTDDSAINRPENDAISATDLGPVPAPIRLVGVNQNSTRPRDSGNFKLFLYIPLCVVCTGIFMTLFLRRIL